MGPPHDGPPSMPDHAEDLAERRGISAGAQQSLFPPAQGLFWRLLVAFLRHLDVWRVSPLGTYREAPAPSWGPSPAPALQALCSLTSRWPLSLLNLQRLAVATPDRPGSLRGAVRLSTSAGGGGVGSPPWRRRLLVVGVACPGARNEPLPEEMGVSTRLVPLQSALGFCAQRYMAPWHCSPFWPECLPLWPAPPPRQHH